MKSEKLLISQTAGEEARSGVVRVKRRSKQAQAEAPAAHLVVVAGAGMGKSGRLIL
jgi:hypothetical protein